MSPIKIDPEIMSGTPCFAGTRVPVQALFDLLKHNRSVDYFLESFPTVKKEQVLAVLEIASTQLTSTPAAATPVNAA